MDYWPLLDLRDAVNDCDALLAEIVADVETLHAESNGHFPPAAADVRVTSRDSNMPLISMRIC